MIRRFAETYLRNVLSRSLLLSAGALALSGCVVEDRIAPGIVNATASSAMGQDAFAGSVGSTYQLRAADKVSVIVFREQELSAPELTISAEGRISVPLVGEVQAAGMTAQQLELRLEQMFDERYLRSPDVSVNVLDYASHLVTVEGAVDRPGLYPFNPGTRLTGGISLASGLERVADVRDVAIFRESSEGTIIAKFDYAQVRAGTMLDPILHPGDRVVVGTDNLSQTWQDLLRALPAFGLFTQIR